MLTKYRVFNAYKYEDKKTKEMRVVIEALNVGKETRFPKRVNLTLAEAQAMLGSEFNAEALGLGFRDKILEVEEVYAIWNEE